jgi:hypothetical protein
MLSRDIATDIRPAGLRIQKPVSFALSGNGAGVVPPEDAVAGARHDSIPQIAHRLRNTPQASGRHPPQCGMRFCMRKSGRLGFSSCRHSLCGSSLRRDRRLRLSGRAQLGCLGQLPQHKDDRIRPPHHALARPLVILDHIHRVQIARIHPMPLQSSRRQRTLQRRETEYSLRIAPQNKLHRPVAQAANAVVKKDGMDHGFASWMTIAGLKAGRFTLPSLSKNTGFHDSSCVVSSSHAVHD